MQETLVQFLGQEDSLEKGMATYSSIQAWRIHGLYSPWVTKSWTWLSDFHFQEDENKLENTVGGGSFYNLNRTTGDSLLCD